jgi:hypothetical protein
MRFQENNRGGNLGEKTKVPEWRAEVRNFQRDYHTDLAHRCRQQHEQKKNIQLINSRGMVSSGDGDRDSHPLPLALGSARLARIRAWRRIEAGNLASRKLLIAAVRPPERIAPAAPSLANFCLFAAPSRGRNVENWNDWMMDANRGGCAVAPWKGRTKIFFWEKGTGRWDRCARRDGMRIWRVDRGRAGRSFFGPPYSSGPV